MAHIDDLIGGISDEKLRRDLAVAVADLRRRRKFGLVYEGHIPETVVVAAEPSLRKGSQVVLRRGGVDKTRYVVERVTGSRASLVNGGTKRTVGIDDLLVVKPFGEHVYPVLRPTGAVVRSDTKAFHTVITGENFHALQLLAFAFERQVDCIYIDPPYNTGARDWKYSNDYVDGNDAWRHSKWLSFMEKRLRLARKLLKPDGVLIVTIDEHEVSNLGVLLKQLFRDARIQMVTIVTNTAGSMSPGLFSRAEEYAYFCFFGRSKPSPMETDLLAESRPVTQFWFPLFRSRGLNDRPSKRPNLVYPVAVDPQTLRIAGFGRSLKDRVEAGEVSGDLDSWQPPADETVDGMPAVWPILDTGEVTTWQLQGASLVKLAEEGFVRVRLPRSPFGPRPYTLSYVKAGNRGKVKAGEIAVSGREPGGALILAGGERDTIPKTVWKVRSHDARLFGTTMLRSLIGATSFNYPKSPYATADTIRTVMADNPNGTILDFFAGSGTTLQSVAMLNRADNGRRRCILVTNNEVDEATVASLAEQGCGPGDEEYEARGICRAVTIPRVTAALSGERNGKPIVGTYLDGTPLAEGFDENAAFFEMAYGDPDRIEVGDRFDDILPVLWLAAGGISDPTSLKSHGEWFVAETARFAVLLDEDRFREFSELIHGRPDIGHVWLVTDSESAFARMRDRLPAGPAVGMLYRDYLRNFVVNTEGRR